MSRVEKSPFFAPSSRSYSQQQQEQQKNQQHIESPGGSKRVVASRTGNSTAGSIPKETKSTIIGATANLINAIVGSGIVGIPYAIQQAGLVTGIGLICTCAILTDKSLRLLVATAKHASAPSYETTMEAAFGRWGFRFVTINMFIMSYGAMVSYLMIVKDTLPLVLLGATGNNSISASSDDASDSVDAGMRRALLFVISITIMLPLSAQRDMANLANTSRISVCCDIIMVLLVAYLAPISSTVTAHGGYWNVIQSSTFRIDTVFVGLGVLSFAFVCQHSAFIIAGSLDRPSQQRWSIVTNRSLWLCVCLANICGISGYLGYMESTQGNILNNLPHNSDNDPSVAFLANMARGLLGTTMLFVFPMELFVSRHVCVVTFFQGRQAHEGEDALILNRRDRRWTLTVILYGLALLPALLFENVGNVLSVTGAIGGSCLSYIGPGMVYLGIHGEEFVQLIEAFWNIDKTRRSRFLTTTTTTTTTRNEHELEALQSATAISTTEGAKATPTSSTITTTTIWTKYAKTILWYVWGMPLWYVIAQMGANGFTQYKNDLVTKSPQPSRLGHVKHSQLQLQQFQIPKSRKLEPPLFRTGSYSLSQTTKSRPIHRSLDDDDIVKRNQGPHIAVLLPTKATTNITESNANTTNEDDDDDEDDPQLAPPNVWDFVMAIAFCCFGVVALCAGLFSIFL